MSSRSPGGKPPPANAVGPPDPAWLEQARFVKTADVYKSGTFAATLR